MNRDTTIGFILIALILVGYSIWMTPSKEEMADRQRIQDSVMMVRQQQRVLDSTRMVEELKLQIANEQQAESVEATAASNESIAASLQDRFGFFALSAQGLNETYTAENEQLKLTFSSKGGILLQPISIFRFSQKTEPSILPICTFDRL